MLTRFKFWIVASYLDVYAIGEESLTPTQRLSVLPEQFDAHRFSHFRGDTLRLSPSGKYLYVTTRGKTPATKGWISVFGVNKDGSVVEDVITRWETGTSGGKANAIELFPFTTPTTNDELSSVTRDWLLLTDDELGYVSVLEFDGQSIREVDSVRLGEGGGEEERDTGASHAVWLS